MCRLIIPNFVLCLIGIDPGHMYCWMCGVHTTPAPSFTSQQGCINTLLVSVPSQGGPEFRFVTDSLVTDIITRVLIMHVED